MNELSVINVNTNETFMSFKANTDQDRVMLYNAINNPEHKIGDFINKDIVIRDVIVMGVEIANEGFDNIGFTPDTKRRANRVVIIDMDGHSYSATSDGIFNSIRTLMSVFGTLHFENGLKVTVKQVTVKRGSLLTLSL